MSMSDEEFDAITSEISQGRATERRLVWKVLLALAVVAVVIIIRWRWAA